MPSPGEQEATVAPLFLSFLCVCRATVALSLSLSRRYPTNSLRSRRTPARGSGDNNPRTPLPVLSGACSFPGTPLGFYFTLLSSRTLARTFRLRYITELLALSYIEVPLISLPTNLLQTRHPFPPPASSSPHHISPLHHWNPTPT